jgi:hypothetical protein
LGLVGKKYFTVQRANGVLEDQFSVIALGCDHVQVSKAKTRDSEMYKSLIGLLGEVDCQILN